MFRTRDRLFPTGHTFKDVFRERVAQPILEMQVQHEQDPGQGASQEETGVHVLLWVHILPAHLAVAKFFLNRNRNRNRIQQMSQLCNGAAELAGVAEARAKEDTECQLTEWLRAAGYVEGDNVSSLVHANCDSLEDLLALQWADIETYFAHPHSGIKIGARRTLHDLATPPTVCGRLVHLRALMP